MDTDTTIIKKLLKENLRLTKENNTLLKKIRRAELFRMWMRFIFLLIVLGVPFLVYHYYLKDYLVELQDTYNGLQGGVENLRSIPDRFSL